MKAKKGHQSITDFGGHLLGSGQTVTTGDNFNWQETGATTTDVFYSTSTATSNSYNMADINQ